MLPMTRYTVSHDTHSARLAFSALYKISFLMWTWEEFCHYNNVGHGQGHVVASVPMESKMKLGLFGVSAWPVCLQCKFNIQFAHRRAIGHLEIYFYFDLFWLNQH